jgi:NADH-quinone oxidoreductase subunit L
MSSTTTYLVWIIMLPLGASVINGLLYIYNIKIQKLNQNIFAFIGVGAPLLSFIISCLIFSQFQSNTDLFTQELFSWIALEKLNVNIAFMADNLSVFMALFITFVGTMIHLYAVGYMDKDDGFGKFFSYFNLFIAFMLILVLADNPLVLFIGWEGVGLCSYLLISFYYEEAKNVEAGNKAIYLNRIGDLGFILGIIVLFFGGNFQGFDFYSIERSLGGIDSDILMLSGVLLFVGAVGKSAQFPLYVWLPDAMRGPTPISALIHAATMVTAGVYLIARFHFLYDGLVNVGLLISYIGAFTALFAAIIATRQNDLKKIFAYSTISQLGYMFMAAGLGLYSAALFHVFTHAFFKAVLFMGAGAVILYTYHYQDIFKIAQNRVKLPFVQLCMLVASLAICAFPPFSGFFSKDLILSSLFVKEMYLLWGIGLFTAFITAYYIFRAYFVVFHSKSDSIQNVVTPHWTISISLGILSVGSLFAGLLNIPHIFAGEAEISLWFNSIEHTHENMDSSLEIVLMLVSVLVSALGVFTAYKKYANIDIYKEHEAKGIVANKFYVDEIYHSLIVKPLQTLSTFLSYSFDRLVIDKGIMNSAATFFNLGKVAARLQSGDMNSYAFIMLFGLNVIILYFYFYL